jgi:hypothetical protein
LGSLGIEQRLEDVKTLHCLGDSIVWTWEARHDRPVYIHDLAESLFMG